MNKKSVLLFEEALLASMLLIPPCIAAENNSAEIEDVLNMDINHLIGVKVVTASKSEDTSLEAPAAVSVVSASDIRNFGYRTLGDILRTLPGLHVSYDRSYQHLGIRGINRKDFNSRVLLLINGQRFNENMFDSMMIERLFMVDIEAIERVEFVPGPGSSMYGNNAMEGVVNIITKQGKKLNHTRMVGSAGSHDTYRGYGEFGKQFENGADVMFTASTFSSHGENLYFKEYDKPENNYGHISGMDGERVNKAFGTFSYQDFNFNVGWSQREKDIPTAPYGSIFNPKEASVDDSIGFIAGNYTKNITTDLKSYIRASYEAYNFHNGYYYTPEVLNRDQIRGRWWNSEFRLEYTGFSKHRLVGGFEIQGNLRQDAKNKDPEYLWLSQSGDSYKYGLFINDHVKISPQWLLDFGARLDYYELSTNITGCSPDANPECETLTIKDSGINPSPRIALIYKPIENTAIKAIYSSAFRAPTPTDLGYVIPPDIIIGNVESEKFYTYELIAEHYVNSNMKIWSNLFINELHGEIKTYNNGGDIRSEGITLGLDWQNNSKSRLFSSYTYAHAKDINTKSRLDDAPLHNLKVGYTMPIFNTDWQAGINGEYISERDTTQANQKTQDYTLINLTFNSPKFFNHLDFSTSIYNLLDYHYEDPAQLTLSPILKVPQPHRTLWFQLAVEF